MPERGGQIPFSPCTRRLRPVSDVSRCLEAGFMQRWQSNDFDGISKLSKLAFDVISRSVGPRKGTGIRSFRTVPIRDALQTLP